MKYDAKRYAQALVEVCQDKTPDEAGVLIDAWLNLIISQGQRSLLSQIVKEVEALYNIDLVEVQIESVKKLDDNTKAWLMDYLSQVLSGQKLVIHEKLNIELLSGYLIKYKDKELNLSLNGILNDLRDQIAA